MSAKKRQDGRYQKKVRVSRPGDPAHYKYVYGTTIREVENKKSELLAQVAAGLDLESDPTVALAIDRWLSEKEPHVRPQTLRNYRFCLNHIKAEMGSRKIRDVSVSDARIAYAKLVKEHPVQAGRAVRFMSAVFRDEIERGIVVKNPFKAVRLVKREQPKKRALTDEELALIDAAKLSRHNRAIISVLRYTGMRRGEALALNVEDVDFDAHCIYITKTVNDLTTINEPKTKAGNRTVPMPPQLEHDIQAYLEQHTGSGLLFPSVHGKPMASNIFEAKWNRIRDAIFGSDAPPDFTPHIMRHTYAHDLVSHDVPLMTAMYLLGHDSIKTTMSVYAHFGYKDVNTDAVINIFDRRVSDRASTD